MISTSKLAAEVLPVANQELPAALKQMRDEWKKQAI